MPRFTATVQAWNTQDFVRRLKGDIRALQSGALPLHQAVMRGGYVDDSDLELTLLRCSDHGETIQAHVGVFFTEIVINCGCGDDPIEENAYCELQVSIDKRTAEAAFSVIPA